MRHFNLGKKNVQRVFTRCAVVHEIDRLAEAELIQQIEDELQSLEDEAVDRKVALRFWNEKVSRLNQ